MADWATTLISGATGIAGVAVGAFLQYQQERMKERRLRILTPAAEMAARLRGAAASLDYLVHGLVTGEPLEDDAFANAKHYVWEANAGRAGIEFAFARRTQAFALATAAVERLKEAYDAARAVQQGKVEGDRAERLQAARNAYDAAIETFIAAVQSATRG